MTTRLVAAQTALIRSMKAARGLSLTYSYGGYSVTVTGWLGNTGVSFLSRVSSEPSAANETSNADFMIVATELILNGSAVSPVIGAEITANGIDYVVVPVNQDDPAWRWSDEQTRLVYRIHATATPWQTVTVYRPTPTATGPGGMRVANLAAVYSSVSAKFIPEGGRFGTEVNRVTTRNAYRAVFQTPTIALVAGDEIDVSGTKYRVMNQTLSGRTSQLPECECERIE